MYNTKLIQLFLAFLMITGIIFLPEIGSAQTELQGVWKATEYSFSSDDTSYTIKDLQPGLFFFTKDYYSVMSVRSTEPRPLMAEDATRSTITDEQIRSIFMSFIANSGKYELNGSKLTIRPVVALWPNVMSGGYYEWEYSIKNDTLLLKFTSGSGAKGQYKLTRLER